MRLKTILSISAVLITSLNLGFGITLGTRPVAAQTSQDTIFLEKVKKSFVEDRVADNLSDKDKISFAQQMCMAFGSGITLKEFNRHLIGLAFAGGLSDEQIKGYTTYFSTLEVEGVLNYCPEYGKIFQE